MWRSESGGGENLSVGVDMTIDVGRRSAFGRSEMALKRPIDSNDYSFYSLSLSYLDCYVFICRSLLVSADQRRRRQLDRLVRMAKGGFICERPLECLLLTRTSALRRLSD